MVSIGRPFRDGTAIGGADNALPEQTAK